MPTHTHTRTASADVCLCVYLLRFKRQELEPHAERNLNSLPSLGNDHDCGSSYSVFRFALVLLLWSFQIFSLPHFPSFLFACANCAGWLASRWTHRHRSNEWQHTRLSLGKWQVIFRTLWPCDVCSTTLFQLCVRCCCCCCWFFSFLHSALLFVGLVHAYLIFFTGALCSHPHATCREKTLPAQNGRHSRFTSQAIYIFGYSFSAHKFSQRSPFPRSYQW